MSLSLSLAGPEGELGLGGGIHLGEGASLSGTQGGSHSPWGISQLSSSFLSQTAIRSPLAHLQSIGNKQKQQMKVGSIADLNSNSSKCGVTAPYNKVSAYENDATFSGPAVQPRDAFDFDGDDNNNNNNNNNIGNGKNYDLAFHNAGASENMIRADAQADDNNNNNSNSPFTLRRRSNVFPNKRKHNWLDDDDGDISPNGDNNNDTNHRDAQPPASPPYLRQTHSAPPVQPPSPLAMGPPSILPTCDDSQTHSFPAISAHTVAGLLTNGVPDGIDRVVFVDCRFPFEYRGGTIPGACNYWLPELAMPNIIGADDAPDNGTCASLARTHGSRVAIIFFCEFSSQRGPKMFGAVRDRDRRRHLVDYPALDLPHMYVLAGGYKEFVRTFDHLVSPSQGAYTPMLDTRFSADLCACRRQYKEAWATRQGGAGRGLRGRARSLTMDCK
ncbi:hypothetical protein PPROV_000445800 [Pycnococcus provasolii]|uniref:protein-tyrosine-phosphatase n=1 Tax=Pycnococcus provasolii TaxID=41880 RepID=A0A830HFX5_9CHLO|nr:hypothetical protein PPROV_000445800 [Pycnococcus provasolii]